MTRYALLFALIAAVASIAFMRARCRRQPAAEGGRNEPRAQRTRRLPKFARKPAARLTITLSMLASARAQPEAKPSSRCRQPEACQDIRDAAAREARYFEASRNAPTNAKKRS